MDMSEYVHAVDAFESRDAFLTEALDSLGQLAEWAKRKCDALNDSYDCNALLVLAQAALAVTDSDGAARHDLLTHGIVESGRVANSLSVDSEDVATEATFSLFRAYSDVCDEWMSLLPELARAAEEVSESADEIDEIEDSHLGHVAESVIDDDGDLYSVPTLRRAIANAEAAACECDGILARYAD